MGICTFAGQVPAKLRGDQRSRQNGATRLFNYAANNTYHLVVLGLVLYNHWLATRRHSRFEERILRR